jgi:hypothetical protein
MTGLHVPPALDELRAAALAADAEEKRFRAGFAAQVARLEEARRHAFRRYAFLKALADADAGAEDREASRAAQMAAAADELDWQTVDDARRPVLDALAALADAVHDSRTGVETADPLQALAAFEAWYADLRGRPFADLFDRYVQETPLVDF